MSYNKRRDLFIVVVGVVSAVAYYFYDIDTSLLSWPISFGIFGCVMSLYLALVEIPSIGDELAKQRDINEKFNEQLIELRDKIKYRS